MGRMNPPEVVTDWRAASRHSGRVPRPDTYRIYQLHHMDYEEYLRTPEWMDRRDAQVVADGWRCRVCNSDEQLHVHHRTYERRGCEAPGDLITLCRECHIIFHEHRHLYGDGI